MDVLEKIIERPECRSIKSVQRSHADRTRQLLTVKDVTYPPILRYRLAIGLRVPESRRTLIALYCCSWFRSAMCLPVPQ